VDIIDNFNGWIYIVPDFYEWAIWLAARPIQSGGRWRAGAVRFLEEIEGEREGKIRSKQRDNCNSGLALGCAWSGIKVEKGSGGGRKTGI